MKSIIAAVLILACIMCAMGEKADRIVFQSPDQAWIDGKEVLVNIPDYNLNLDAESRIADDLNSLASEATEINYNIVDYKVDNTTQSAGIPVVDVHIVGSDGIAVNVMDYVNDWGPFYNGTSMQF